VDESIVFHEVLFFFLVVAICVLSHGLEMVGVFRAESCTAAERAKARRMKKPKASSVPEEPVAVTTPSSTPTVPASPIPPPLKPEKIPKAFKVSVPLDVPSVLVSGSSNDSNDLSKAKPAESTGDDEFDENFFLRKVMEQRKQETVAKGAC
jgi:hypothetical protein